MEISLTSTQLSNHTWFDFRRIFITGSHHLPLVTDLDSVTKLNWVLVRSDIRAASLEFSRPGALSVKYKRNKEVAKLYQKRIKSNVRKRSIYTGLKRL